VDDMLATDEADVVAALSYPLPVMVIANMMGVADGDLGNLRALVRRDHRECCGCDSDRR
jgi:cytochrome P450